MSLEEGSNVAINTCLGVTEEDKVVILSDEDSQEIGLGLRKAALEITPQVRYFKLELYGDRPLNKMPDQIKSAVQEATASVWTAKAVDGELESIRKPFIQSAVTNGRLAHMVNINKELMRSAMAVDYGEVESFTNKMLSLAEKTKNIRISSKRGTDVTVRVGKYKWVASTGIIRGVGSWYNLPAGQIYTTPASMKGTVIIDGTLGDYFDSIYSISDLEEDPIHLEIRGEPRPKVTELECGNSELKQELESYLNRNRCSSYIGEIGLGTNVFLEELAGNMLQDDKFPTPHIACGDPNEGMTFAGWSCPEHIDMVIQECDVWFDEKKVMEEGKYLIH